MAHPNGPSIPFALSLSKGLRNGRVAHGSSESRHLLFPGSRLSLSPTSSDGRSFRTLYGAPSLQVHAVYALKPQRAHLCRRFIPGASNQPSYAGSGALALCRPIDDSGGLLMPALRVVSRSYRTRTPQRELSLIPSRSPKTLGLPQDSRRRRCQIRPDRLPAPESRTFHRQPSQNMQNPNLNTQPSPSPPSPSIKLEGSTCAQAQVLPSVYSFPSPLMALKESGIKGVRVFPSDSLNNQSRA